MKITDGLKACASNRDVVHYGLGAWSNPVLTATPDPSILRLCTWCGEKQRAPQAAKRGRARRSYLSLI